MILMIIGAIIAIAGPWLAVHFMNEGVHRTDQVRFDKGTGKNIPQADLFLSTNGIIVASVCGALGTAMMLVPAFAPNLFGN